MDATGGYVSNRVRCEVAFALTVNGVRRRTRGRAAGGGPFAPVAPDGIAERRRQTIPPTSAP